MPKIEYPVYRGVICGELQGSATALQLPDIACSWVVLKARSDNAGSVYIGKAAVTKADGTTDTTTGFELAPGESTPVLELDNLKRLYRICDNAGDDLTYLGAKA